MGCLKYFLGRERAEQKFTSGVQEKTLEWTDLYFFEPTKRKKILVFEKTAFASSSFSRENGMF